MTRGLMGLGLLVLALSVTSCMGKESTPSSDESTVQTYTARGVVTQLPAGPGTELMISHEAIPDFISARGDTVGMNAMTMGFPVSDGLSLDAISVGDSIDFRFEVRWAGSPPLRVTSIERR